MVITDGPERALWRALSLSGCWGWPPACASSGGRPHACLRRCPVGSEDRVPSVASATRCPGVASASPRRVSRRQVSGCLARGGACGQAADLKQSQSERLDLGQHAVQGGLLGDVPCRSVSLSWLSACSAAWSRPGGRGHGSGSPPAAAGRAAGRSSVYHLPARREGPSGSSPVPRFAACLPALLPAGVEAIVSRAPADVAGPDIPCR